MTWRWNAFSIRLTPTRPSRTKSELSREGISASCSDHVGTGNPILQGALLAIEAHPQEPQEQRRHAGQVPGAPGNAPPRRRWVAVDVDDLHLEDAHAERA